MIREIILFADSVFPKPSSLPTVEANQNTIGTVLHVVFGIFAAIAVLVVTIAGLQYVLSQGDPQKTAKAKNTILYAVIGLVVAMMGYVIVSFVVGKVA
jgi:uncharacterized membrane protein YidH (DUF202 family)